MPDINGVEPDQRGEQSPVGFRQRLADEIALRRKPRLDLIERGEERAIGFFVSLLRRCEASAIHAVVDVWIDEVVDAVDLAAQRRRIVVGAYVGQRVERAVEHADDVGRLVIDDGAALLVPQHWHGNAAGELRIGLEIDVGQALGAVDGIAGRAGSFVEGPALAAHVIRNQRDGDRVLQPLERAEDQRAVCPRAREADIKMIASPRRGKAAFAGWAGGAVRRHPVAEGRRLALEPALARLGVVPLVVPDAVDQQAHYRLRGCRRINMRATPPLRKRRGRGADGPVPEQMLIGAQWGQT